MAAKSWLSSIGLALCVMSCAPASGRAFGEDEDRTGGGLGSGSPSASTEEPAAGAAVQGVATFTAIDVARILLVLEETAITQARLAEQSGVVLEVRTYAARMIRERGEAAARLVSALYRAASRSEDPTPALLEHAAQRGNEALAELPKADFDLPFMTSEIATHARLLGLIDASLLPSVRRATSRGEGPISVELEEVLLEIRAATAAHVVHALRVQGVLRTADPPTDDATSADAPAVAPGPIAAPASR